MFSFSILVMRQNAPNPEKTQIAQTYSDRSVGWTTRATISVLALRNGSNRYAGRFPISRSQGLASISMDVSSRPPLRESFALVFSRMG